MLPSKLNLTPQLNKLMIVVAQNSESVILLDLVFVILATQAHLVPIPMQNSQISPLK